MKFRSYDMEQGERVTRPSPGRCIYCGAVNVRLTDEHVIPYALGGHTVVFEKASCVSCAQTIQRYEQRILRAQLAAFRARLDAPTRNKKDRPTTQKLRFVEVDSAGHPVRFLGEKNVPLEQAPLCLSVWQLALPRILGEGTTAAEHIGRPWTSLASSPKQRELALCLARGAARQYGVEHAAIKVDQVDREAFLRFIVKTAHAYASFELGLERFVPLATDLILNRNDDLAELVGCCPVNDAFQSTPANMSEFSVGRVQNGPAEGYTAVYIRLYPVLGTPPHMVVVGRPR